MPNRTKLDAVWEVGTAKIGFEAEHRAIALRDLVACVVRRTAFNDAKMIMTKIDIRGRRGGKC